MRTCKTSPKGFTMIENILAVVIVSIGIIPLIQQMTSNFVYRNTATNRAEAYSYAKDGIESVVNDDWIDFCLLEDACFKKFDLSDALVSAVDADDTGNILKNGEPSIFYQYLYFDQTDLVNEAYLVSMTVKWEDSLGDHTSVFEQIISK